MWTISSILTAMFPRPKDDRKPEILILDEPPAALDIGGGMFHVRRRLVDSFKPTYGTLDLQLKSECLEKLTFSQMVWILEYS